jgi:phage replication O-like protein O
MAKANPQKENGYTAIANEIMEQLAQVDFSPHETRLLMVLFRKTYGWGKKFDKIPLMQFEMAAKLERRCVTRTLKKLESRKIIVVYRGAERETNTYSFNKVWSDWTGGKSVEKLSKGRDSGVPTPRDSGDPTWVGTAVTHSITTLKENITKASEPDQSTCPHDDTPNERIKRSKKALLSKMSL